MCNLKPSDTESRFFADFNKMGERPKQRIQQQMKGWQRGAGVGKERGREDGKQVKRKSMRRKNPAVVKEQKRDRIIGITY